MNISTEADSLDELHSVIDETMQLLLVDLLRDNELDRFLMARGWKALNIPTRGDQKDVEFNVPWQLIAEGSRDSKRSDH